MIVFRQSVRCVRTVHGLAHEISIASVRGTHGISAGKLHGSSSTWGIRGACAESTWAVRGVSAGCLRGVCEFFLRGVCGQLLRIVIQSIK